MGSVQLREEQMRIRFFKSLGVILILVIVVTLWPPATVQAAERFVPGQLVVGLDDTITPADLNLPAGASLAATPDILTERLNTVLVNVPAGKEMEYRTLLLALPGVLYAEPNYYVTAQVIPNDSRWINQWGPEDIHAPEAWDVTRGSTNVTIAIVDSGIDISHPEFAGRMLPGYDFVNHDTSVEDRCGHGTHVAGIAAANGDNSVGVAGMDWHARILPVKVLGNTCTGTNADVAAGIAWATDQGADVINLSLGTETPSNLLENSTYYAYSHGAAVIAAGGNYTTTLAYPARYTWVLPVGAVDPANNLADFSAMDVSMVVAPGVDILSTTPVHGSFYIQTESSVTNQYGYMSGTSMAAPYASGSAALLIASNPTRFNTPDKIYAALRNTTTDLGDPGQDSTYGYGLINIRDALDYIPAATPPPATPPVYYLSASSRNCSSVSFAWDDTSTTTPIPVYGSGDHATVNLPFTFSFGGQTFTTVTASSDGYLTFDSLSPFPLDPEERQNWLLPAKAIPSRIIAPFWDTLTPSASFTSRINVKTFGTTPNRRFVVEWLHLKRVDNLNTDLTFETTLYEGSNQIKFQYQAMTGLGADGSSATVGLGYNDGNTGLLISYNQANAVHNGEAILLLPAPYGSAFDNTCSYIAQNTTGAGTHDAAPFCLNIADGSLRTDTTVRISLLGSFTPLPSGVVNLGRFASISLDPRPRGDLNPPAQVCYHYSAGDVLRAGGHPENLYISRYDGGAWQKLTTYLDEVNALLTADTEHFSVFGVFANAPQTLPVTGAPLGALRCVAAALR
jgi:subtilisin family serine protease